MELPRAGEAILLVDDEVDFANGLSRLIQKDFPQNPVLMRRSGAEALELLQERPFALLITDLRMPGMNGVELLEKALAVDPALCVVVLTGFGAVEPAVAALKAGAYDFVTKPIDQQTLRRVVEKGLERAALLRENTLLREAMDGCVLDSVLLGESSAMQRLRGEIEAVAAADYNVLITGESGSGKELAARTIHALSRRSRRPMLTVNCTAIPEPLMESELFGHVKGAFTGAERSRQGLFVAASGSSLLLDEIGDMPLRLQPKLLRALQEKEIRPLGGSQNIPVDARILASTNLRLEQSIAAGAFREDLYYRLNVLTVRVPPLRERAKDVPTLAVHFLARACRELDIEDKRFEPEALERLASMPWPGNVRELLNVVRRLAVFSRSPVIGKSQVQLLDKGHVSGALSEGLLAATAGVGSYKSAKSRFLEDFTRSYVEKLLEEAGGNVSQAARVSGLERVSLQKILKRLGVDAEKFRSPQE